MPKFTIVVPARHEQHAIARCLDSMKRQSFKDFECICVIEDLDTVNAARECTADDRRFNVIYGADEASFMPGNVSASRNIAIDRASGEFVMFADADDWLEDNALQVLQEAIAAHPYEQLVQFSLKRLNAKQEASIIQSCSGVHKIEDKDFFSGLLTHTASKTVKRSLIDENSIRFCTKTSRNEDKLFWLQAALAAKSYVGLSQQLYVYDKHFSKLSRKCNNTYENFSYMYIGCLDAVEKFQKTQPEKLSMDDLKSYVFRYAEKFKSLADAIDKMRAAVPAKQNIT